MNQSIPNSILKDTKDDFLLLEFARTYMQLQNLHRIGSEHWPEDEDPLMLCMDRLLEGAAKLKVHTPQGCMALIAMTSDDWKGKLEANAGTYDKLEGNAIKAARDMLASGEFLLGGWRA